MKNFEKFVDDRATLKRLYDHIKNSLVSSEIPLETFVDLYGAEAVERDKKYIAEKEKLFAQSSYREQAENHQLARIFETIFHDHAELSEWLGANAMTIKCSRYDDICNGIDTIAEFQEGESSASHLGLAIDVTTAQGLIKKFDRIRDEIDRGKLAKVKYFVSKNMNIRGELSNIPRVVIGADRSTVKELGELYLDKDYQALAEHPIQFQVLDEIVEELQAFQQYALRVKQPKLVRVFGNMQKLAENIISEKRKTVEDSGKRDAVYAAIQGQLVHFENLI
jgi:hypothetical protein